MIKKANISLVVLVPCYNEEEMLDIFYSELIKAIEAYNYKVIFINDGSTDRTLQQLKAIAAYNNRCQYISFSRNFGHQVALRAGYDFATDADCVISIDADLQQPPHLINSLVQEWIGGFQVVNAVRTKNQKLTFFKRKTSLLFYKLINLFSSRKILESSPDFRLIDKKLVSILTGMKEQNLFLREIISWVGFKQKNIEFEVDVRRFGRSKYTIKKMLSLAMNGIFTYGINPLRIAIFMGIGLSVVSFAYAFFAIYNYIFTNSTVPGWTSMIASFLFIAGFQFILIGVIGEYLGKTYLDVKCRPIYLIDESSISVEPSLFDLQIKEVDGFQIG